MPTVHGAQFGPKPITGAWYCEQCGVCVWYCIWYCSAATAASSGSSARSTRSARSTSSIVGGSPISPTGAADRSVPGPTDNKTGESPGGPGGSDAVNEGSPCECERSPLLWLLLLLLWLLLPLRSVGISTGKEQLPREEELPPPANDAAAAGPSGTEGGKEQLPLEEKLPPGL